MSDVTQGYWERTTENPRGISNSEFMPPTFEEYSIGNLIKIEIDRPLSNGLYTFDQFLIPTESKNNDGRLRTETVGPGFHIREGVEWTGIVLGRELKQHPHAISAATLAIAIRKGNYYMLEALITDGVDYHLIWINSINCTYNGLRVSRWIYTNNSVIL